MIDSDSLTYTIADIRGHDPDASGTDWGMDWEAHRVRDSLGDRDHVYLFAQHARWGYTIEHVEQRSYREKRVVKAVHVLDSMSDVEDRLQRLYWKDIRRDHGPNRELVRSVQKTIRRETNEKTLAKYENRRCKRNRRRWNRPSRYDRLTMAIKLDSLKRPETNG